MNGYTLTSRVPPVSIIALMVILLPGALIIPANLSASEPIKLDEKVLTGQNVTSHCRYLPDQEKKLTIEDVSSREYRDRFKDIEEDVPNFGYTTAAYWVQVPVYNSGNRSVKWFLEYAYAQINYIDFYYPSEEGYRVKKVSAYYPFANRDVKHVTYVFRMKSRPGLHTFYMRVVTRSPMVIVLKAWSNIAMFEAISAEKAVIIAFLGILLVMGIYNFFIFLMIRKANYFYYTGLNFTLLLLFTIFYGYGFQYLWPTIPGLNDLIIPLLLISGAAGLMFIRNYFDVKIHTERLDRFVLMPAVILTTLLAFAFMPVYQLLGEVQKKDLIAVSMILSLMGIILCLGFCLVYLFKMRRKALFLLSAFFLFLVGAFVHQLADFGVVPVNFITMHGVNVGAIAMLALFSLGMGDEIHRMKNELLVLNTDLEGQVQKRTEQLNTAVNELEQINEELIERQVLAEKELNLAVHLQKEIYSTAVPDDEKWDVAVEFKPYFGISGDLYDFYYNSGSLKGVSLFDISGHGISAALIALLAKSIVNRNFTGFGETGLNRVAERVNSELIREIGVVDYYLTGILLRFQDEYVEYVNAGHTRLLLKRNGKNSVIPVEPKEGPARGNLLGIKDFSDNRFQVVKFPVSTGDVLVLYTDCLTETSDRNDCQYGEDGLMNALEKAPEGSSSKEILSCIMDDFRESTGADELHDDLTVLVMKRK